jgi:excisionase family DNA binding protein
MKRESSGFANMLAGKQAASHVGLSLWAFRRLFLYQSNKKHPLAHYKIGKRYFFKKEDLDKWVEQHRIV